MSNRCYTPEFKEEAARLIILEGLPVKEVAEQLGVNKTLLYDWKREHLSKLESERIKGQPSPKAMAKEIADLRKQLAKSKKMNEILKKTVGYFSKDA